MKHILTRIALSALAVAALSSAVFGQETPAPTHDPQRPHPHMDSAVDTDTGNAATQAHSAPSDETHDEWAQGNIRRIDRLQGKLTLRHGPLLTVDMPAMTMVFAVRERNALDTLKVGDDIAFRVIKDPAGKLLITDIRRP